MSLVPGIRAQSIPMHLSSTEKFYGLSRVWQEVNYTFAGSERNPDLDWDSLYKAYIPQVIKSANDYDYYRLLQRFSASLGDPNTFVQMPSYLSDSMNGPPILLQEVRGRVYVVNTGKHLSELLPIGSEITRINGFSITSFLQQEVFPYIPAGTPHGRMAIALEQMLTGWINTQVLLNYITPDGRNMNEQFTRSNNARVKWVNEIPDGNNTSLVWITKDVALIRINRFNRETYNTFPKSRELVKAKGIIIDLRQNNFRDRIGFAAEMATRMSDAPYLLLPGAGMRNMPFRYSGVPDELIQFGLPERSPSFRHHPPDTFHVSSRLDTIRQPLAILTGPKTGNAAEHFLMFMQQSPERATVIGEQTAGSTGTSISSPLPGGGVLHVNVKEDFYPEDPWLRDGFLPDIVVPQDIKSLLNGEDKALAKALEVLKKVEIRGE
jgi:hypothetical protein